MTILSSTMNVIPWFFKLQKKFKRSVHFIYFHISFLKWRFSFIQTLFILIISVDSNLSFINVVGYKVFVVYRTFFSLPAAVSIMFVIGLENLFTMTGYYKTQIFHATVPMFTVLEWNILFKYVLLENILYSW